jgi:PQQ system protein
VVTQLDPAVARLVNALPEVDQPNELVIAKLYALGGLAKAREGPDGVMRVQVSVLKDEFLWRPAVITMPHGGTLELEFTNPDDEIHMALMPSNGARQVLELPPLSAGRMRIQLDGPGWYWFHCPVANHYGRGMYGYVLVGGNVPVEARLDRPPQPLPRN